MDFAVKKEDRNERKVPKKNEIISIKSENNNNNNSDNNDNNINEKNKVTVLWNEVK